MVPAHQDEPAAGAEQLLVGACGRDMGDINRAGVLAGDDESRDVRDVCQQVSTNFVGNVAEPLKIDDRGDARWHRR